MMDSQEENGCFVIYYVGCDGHINKPNSSHLSQLTRMSGFIIFVLNLKQRILRGHILLIFYNRNLYVLPDIRNSFNRLHKTTISYPNKSVLLNIDS